jgi:hypothetical protein
VTTELDGPPAPADVCTREPGGPLAPAVTLFVMADSQLHELGGARFPGQTELADALVPAAVRPVELDLLSAVPLAHFRRAFGQVLAAAPGAVFWAHLGDLADLACTGELARALGGLEAFPAARLAGIAPGNHDTSFTGNFSWSPFWRAACGSSGRLDKAASLAQLEPFIGRGAADQPARAVSVVRSAWPAFLGGGPEALVTVTPLGVVSHRGRPRGLVAVFLDTADRAAFDRGIAGLYGTFSADQAARLRALVAELPARAGATYADPIFLVLGHHPIGELTAASADRLKGFLAWLDDDPLGADRRPARSRFDRDPRILAVLTAHTHHVESHRHCVGLRALREIVVGSTIDPPQQAALVEVGADARGLASVRVRTVPAVGRPGLTCGPTPATIPARDCAAALARLADAPACARLFDEDQAHARDCAVLEQPLELGGKMARLARASVAFEPDDIKDQQRARARRLLGCVCRAQAGGGRACAPAEGGDPLDAEAFAALVDARLRAPDPAAAPELVCLSWAAAALQAHKATGMTYTEALRCAFDDPTIPAAQELVATLEAGPCQ